MMTMGNFSGSNYRNRELTVNNARIAQLVERVLGKDEVTGSIPVVGSTRQMPFEDYKLRI